MKYQLKQEFRIESARSLPQLPPEHPCSRIHGHSFKIRLTLEGPLDQEKGWLMDFNEIAEATQPLLDQLDHRLLNEIPGLENPTSEILASWIFERLKKTLPLLTRVEISETPDTLVAFPV